MSYRTTSEMVQAIIDDGPVKDRILKSLKSQHKKYEAEIASACRYLDRIPQYQREEAEKLIRLAVALGWKSIGFWEGWQEGDTGWEPLPATIRDMFGVNPDTGLGAFITRDVLLGTNA